MGANGSRNVKLRESVIIDFAKTSNLTVDQLRREEEVWRKTNKSGVVSKKDFKNYLGIALPSINNSELRYQNYNAKLMLTLCF